MRSHRARVVAVALTLAFGQAPSALAQIVQPSTHRQDPGRIIRVWASGGLGTAAFSGVGGGASARASGNISVDRAAVIFRMTGSIEGVDGHVFEDEGPVMAYDIGVHASKLFAGVALNIMGVTGPGRRNLTAIVLSLELGAFGR